MSLIGITERAEKLLMIRSTLRTHIIRQEQLAHLVVGETITAGRRDIFRTEGGTLCSGRIELVTVQSTQWMGHGYRETGQSNGQSEHGVV